MISSGSGLPPDGTESAVLVPQGIARPGKALTAKYGAPSEQLVVSVTNKVLHTQVWFNQARGSKPQNFKAAGHVTDPTDHGANW